MPQQTTRLLKAVLYSLYGADFYTQKHSGQHEPRATGHETRITQFEERRNIDFNSR
jgi:hypothetical protein